MPASLGRLLPAYGRGVRRTPDSWEGRLSVTHTLGPCRWWHLVPGCSATAGPAPRVHPASPTWCCSGPRGGGVSGSGMGSDWLQVMQAGDGEWGHPGPLVQVPALSNVLCQTSRRPCCAGRKGGRQQPWHEPSLPALTPQGPGWGTPPHTQPKNPPACGADTGANPPGSAMRGVSKDTQ